IHVPYHHVLDRIQSHPHRSKTSQNLLWPVWESELFIRGPTGGPKKLIDVLHIVLEAIIKNLCLKYTLGGKVLALSNDCVDPSYNALTLSLWGLGNDLIITAGLGFIIKKTTDSLAGFGSNLVVVYQRPINWPNMGAPIKKSENIQTHVMAVWVSIVPD
ncbi:hypothetical protein B0H11DRAFT_2032617, partial [Mycena galericulata]